MATVPSFFIPAKPPTPPSASSQQPKLDFFKAVKSLSGNTSFYLVLIPFAVYVGFFNAASSLLNQIFEPYGFSETEAGIAGAILIVVGLIASAIVSPIVDRTKIYLITIKTLVPLISIGYVLEQIFLLLALTLHQISDSHLCTWHKVCCRCLCHLCLDWRSFVCSTALRSRVPCRDHASDKPRIQ